MTLTELRYIVALAHERHFGRAAEKCFVAQPTLSVAVKKLEDELGVVLFERGSGEIRATPVGEIIVHQAEKVLGEAARITELAQSAGDPLVGPLRLGAIHTIGPYLFPSLVPLLHRRAPRMLLYLHEDFTARLVERIKAAELDVAIVALPVNEPGLVAQPVYDEAFRVLVPADHPWAGEVAIDAKLLTEQPLLLLGRGNCFRDQVLDLCAQAGAGGPQVVEGSSLETIRLMVASGVGLTVMPASAVDRLAENDSLLRARPFLPPQPSRRVGLLWRASFPRFQLIDLLREALLDCRLSGTQPVSASPVR